MDDKSQLMPDKEPVINAKYGYKIPVCTPFLTQKEVEYAMDALRSGWISGGKGEYIDKFEMEFAKKTGTSFAVSVNSGTSALHLGYRLLDLPSGSEVVVPNFTMVSTISPMWELGLVPVTVDCDQYGTIDAAKIEEKITPRTKAIAATHIYGNPCDIDAIEALALKHNLKVLYDAAEAHGAMWKGKRIGYFGNVVCYSFYANKIITTGEGGMVTFNTRGYLKEADRLRDEYFSPDRHFYHESHGYSYRMSNLHAAIGAAQTERFEELVEARRKHERMYRELLDGLPLAFLPMREGHVVWMHCVLVNDAFEMSRNDLRQALAGMGIETRMFFIPMNLQPDGRMPRGEFPESEQLSGRGFYLPSSGALSDMAIVYVADRIREIYHKRRAT